MHCLNLPQFAVLLACCAAALAAPLPIGPVPRFPPSEHTAPSEPSLLSQSDRPAVRSRRSVSEGRQPAETAHFQDVRAYWHSRRDPVADKKYIEATNSAKGSEKLERKKRENEPANSPERHGSNSRAKPGKSNADKGGSRTPPKGKTPSANNEDNQSDDTDESPADEKHNNPTNPMSPKPGSSTGDEDDSNAPKGSSGGKPAGGKDPPQGGPAPDDSSGGAGGPKSEDEGSGGKKGQKPKEEGTPASSTPGTGTAGSPTPNPSKDDSPKNQTAPTDTTNSKDPPSVQNPLPKEPGPGTGPHFDTDSITKNATLVGAIALAVVVLIGSFVALSKTSFCGLRRGLGEQAYEPVSRNDTGADASFSTSGNQLDADGWNEGWEQEDWGADEISKA